MSEHPRPVQRLTDPRALRALAHPLRLSLLATLRAEGPLTATGAGELLGQSSASCSFHLRQLAKYGLVQEAGGGHGRQRPWRATAMFTEIPDIAGNRELSAAAGRFRSVVAERYFAQMMHWLATRADEPADWQEAGQFGDTMLYLSAAELSRLDEQVRALIEPYLGRQLSPELRPPGARLVSYLHLAFPATRGLAGRDAISGGAACRRPGTPT